MDEKFQDRIDDYMLNRMEDAEKAKFLREVEQDEEKKDQLEFTRNVKDSVCSREEKLRALAQFQQQYEKEREVAAFRATGTDAACYCPAPEMEERPVRPKNRKWLWISGMAAVLVIGFFAIKPMFVYDSLPNLKGIPTERVRGGDDVFIPADSADNDTIMVNIEKKVTPDE